MTNYKLFSLKNIPTNIFTMTPLELCDYVDFEVKRVYFITSPSGLPTGNHAHYKEDELFIMLQGTCNINVDDGSGLTKVELVGAKNAIYVPHHVWHGFSELSRDAILLALSSTNYNPSREDYCEDYGEFQKLTETLTS